MISKAAFGSHVLGLVGEPGPRPLLELELPWPQARPRPHRWGFRDALELLHTCSVQALPGPGCCGVGADTGRGRGPCGCQGPLRPCSGQSPVGFLGSCRHAASAAPFDLSKAVPWCARLLLGAWEHRPRETAAASRWRGVLEPVVGREAMSAGLGPPTRARMTHQLVGRRGRSPAKEPRAPRRGPFEGECSGMPGGQEGPADLTLLG